MVTITYEIGCRTCNNTDGTKHMYQIQDGDVKKYLLKPEYETVQLIEKWREEDGHKCQYCGSKSVEVSDIEINNQQVYDFNTLSTLCQMKGVEMFMISIDKDNYGLELNHGGSNNPDKKFVNKCIKKTLNLIKKEPEQNYKSHNIGSFFICFTGDIFQGTNKNIIIQKFRHSGISKNDLTSTIKTELDYYL